MSSGALPSNLTGIIATKPDLAPSIIFAIAFVVLVPVAVWRAVSPATRSKILIRPTIFCLVRIGTYIVRALEANGNYTTSVIATELVLLTVGTILLVEPLIELTKQLLEAFIPDTGPAIPDRRGRIQRRDEVGILSRLLKVALVAVVVMSIYTATQIGSAFTSQDAAQTVSTLRKVISIVVVAVLGVVAVALVYFHLKHDLPMRPVGFLLLIALLLEITSAYRLASVEGDSGARNRVAFWLASALPEWLAALTYLSINLNSLIPAKFTGSSQSHPTGSYPMQRPQQPPQSGYV